MDSTPPTMYTSAAGPSSQPDNAPFIPQPASSSSMTESPRPAPNTHVNGNVNGNNHPQYGMYPYYPPGPQQMPYPPAGRPFPPYPPNANGRYNEPYPPYPQSPFYGVPPMGAPGPGPGTMQNYSGGPNLPYPDYPNQNYGRQPPFPRNFQPDPNPPPQPLANFDDASAGDSNGGMNEAPPYTSHPPPPSIPPPGQAIPNQQANGQGGQPNGPKADYMIGGGYYWPSGHPYSYGGGVGYPNPGTPYGYPYDPYNQPSHPGHVQHPHPYPNQHHPSQHHPSGQPNWSNTNGHPPHHRENSAVSSGSGGTGSKLNPAAAGFTFTPGKKDFSAVNGTTPVFASLAQPSTQPSKPAASLPNGTASAGASTTAQAPKKFTLPVVVDGEKFKGMNAIEPSSDGLTFGSQQSETSEPAAPALGLSQMDANSSSTTATTPDTSNAAPTPLSESITSASSFLPPTTPNSNRTPRAADAELQGDGEASILFSPKSAGSSSEGVLKFIGSPISGYTSPTSLSSAVFTVLPPKKKKSPTVVAEPYVLVAARPSAASAGGVTYNAALSDRIPNTYKVETIQQENAGAQKRQRRKQRSKPNKGARVTIGTPRDRAPAIRGDVLAFGEVAELTPRAVDLPVLTPDTLVESASTPTAPAADRIADEITVSQKSSSQSDVPTAQAPNGQSLVAEKAAPPLDGSAPPVSSSSPAPPKAKPSSWAALLKPGSSRADSGQPAQPKAETRNQQSIEANEAAGELDSDGVRTPVVRFSENEAGPSRLSPGPVPPSPVSAPKTNGAAKPIFNYAAAAASNAGLSPAEELAKILSDGVSYQQSLGKSKGKEVGMVPRGLINTGNMCFANTILQVLVYCPPFTDLLEELGKRLKADLARKTPLLEAMIIFLREFAPGPQTTTASIAAQLPTPPSSGTSTPRNDAKTRDAKKEAFVPENVYDAMKENKRFDSMRRGHQEDAEEYLGFFLNTLHEELLYVLSRTSVPKAQALPNGTEQEEGVAVQRPVSPDADTEGDGWLEVGKKQKTNVVRATETRESAITRIFGGTIRSVLTTPGMKNSVTLEPYQPLQLDVQSPEISSITDALRHLSQPEIVPGVWSASRKANVDATKQITIETFPRVLILHLKRFVFEMSELSVVKRSKPVAYGTELVIPPEIISPGRRQQPIKYRLFGVVYHHGYSAAGGHYTVAVSRPDTTSGPTSQWFHFDDETVATVPTEQVVVSEQEARDVKDGKVRENGLSIAGRERCAYLLFYQRVRE